MVSGWFVLRQTELFWVLTPLSYDNLLSFSLSVGNFFYIRNQVLETSFLYKESRKAVYLGPSSVHKTVGGFQLNLRKENSERPY